MITARRHIRAGLRPTPTKTNSVIVLLILALVFGARLLALRQVDMHSVAGVPLEDDAFYYFALGRNISAGQGVRIDSLHTTTGFQPLWGAVNAAAFFLLGESDQTIFCILTLGALVGVLTCAVIFALTRRVSRSPAAGMLAAGLWGFAPQTIRHNLNGMETGIAVLFSLAILYSFVLTCERPARWRILLTGLVCGVGFLARVDTLMLSGLVGLALVAFFPVGWTLRDRACTGMLFTTAAAIPVLPWLLLVWYLDKPMLPESGQAVRLIGLYLSPVPPPRLETVWSDAGHFLDFYGGWAADFIRQFAAQVPILAAARLLPVDEIIGSTRLNPLVWLAWGLIGICGLLAWFSRARMLRIVFGVFVFWSVSMTLAYSVILGGVWFFARYSLPVAEVFGVLALALIGRAILRPVVGGSCQDAPASRPRTAFQMALIGSIVFYSAASLYAYVWAVRDDPSYTWIADAGSVPEDGFYETVQWLETMTTPDMHVGMFQSGLLSYYGTRTVLNLDGKVNPDARRALRDGRMWDYICAAGIDYLADWPLMVEHLLVNRSAHWQADHLAPARLVEAERVSALVIYWVNRANCPER